MKNTGRPLFPWRWCLPAVLLLSALAPQAQGRTLDEIHRTGELRICVTGSSVEFYQANGEDFARSLGVRGKTTLLSDWDQQFQNAQGVTVTDDTYESALLASGQCDLYPNDLHMAPWRMKKMLLVPLFRTRNVVVARPDLRGLLNRPQDLGGRVAAVLAGTSYEAWLKELNTSLPQDRAVVIQNTSTDESMRRVAAGRADFTVIAAESSFHFVRDDLEHLDVLFAVGEATEVGWGISPKATDLREALERYFVASRRVASRLDLSWRKNYGISLVEYQLFSASFDDRAQLLAVWSKWGIPVVSAIAGIGLAMLFWVRRMRYEIVQHRIAAEALRDSQALMALEAARRRAVSELLLALQQTDTLQQFANAVLREVAHHLPLGQALFATVHPAHGTVAQAHYAGSGATAADTLAQMPEAASLLDRCAATGESVLVERPGPDYLRIRSGLGNAAPAAILLLPVLRGGAVVAVMELAVSQPFTPDQRRLLDELAPIVSVSLERFQRVAQAAAPATVEDAAFPDLRTGVPA